MSGAAELEPALLEKPGWTRERLEAEITAQQERFAGLLTRDGAIELIARENGLKAAEQQVVFDSLSAARTKPGANANVRVRVWHAFAPKRFTKRDEKGERHGRVCNVLVKDATGDATLVLWGNDVALVEKGTIERNDVLEVRGAFVKNTSPLELHTGMLTRINVALGDFPTIPENPKAGAKIPSLSDGIADADFYGRILRLGRASEFTRISKTGMQEKGLVCDCVLSDGKGSVRCVAWDENARILSHATPGDAVKIEGAYLRKSTRGTGGDLEAHVSWQGRIVISPRRHSLAQTTQIWEGMYPRRLLSELKDGEQALVTAKLVELRSASVSVKCTACGEKVQAAPCPACGSDKIRRLLIVRTRLDDGFSNIACTFFGSEALELLGLKELTLEAQTALELKKDYLVGSELSLILAPKASEMNGELETIAKTIVSTQPAAASEANAMHAMLENN